MSADPRVTRRAFLRRYGIASSAITLSPFFIDRFANVSAAAAPLVRVFKVMNGDCFQNVAKVLDMLGGIGKYISAQDVVVIKANAQWPNQGYTHTGCIKAVIDAILAIPGFAGEILLCDNGQTWSAPGAMGWDATPANRTNNWPDQNWNSLIQTYSGKPVAGFKWASILAINPPGNVPSMPYFAPWNPANGQGWGRSFLNFRGRPSFISYPVFQSPLSGKLIDMKNGVWQNGGYTGQKVKAIFIPTLNNHSLYGSADDNNSGSSGDYAGVTSAIKSFYGATEIPVGTDSTWNGYYHIHSTTYTQPAANGWVPATGAGQLVGQFMNTFYMPVLFITAAMWSGWYSRTGQAAATNTVLACENPVTLDYVSTRDVISPYAPWLNPDQNNNTRQQILGCNSQGIGTIDLTQFEIITYDFNNPTASRLDVERKIRDFKAGVTTEADVKNTINLYRQSP